MRTIRERFGVNQTEFASVAKVSQGTVSRWEKGQWEPNRDELARIREEAISRGIDWNDALFFSSPDHSCDDGAR